MSIDRATIISGPALVTFGGQSFWSKGDITVKNTVSRFEVGTSRFGKVDERLQDKRIVVSFEPTGRFTTALAAILWPFATAAIGSSVFGATDSALVINTLAGNQHTIHNAALTGTPDINLGVGQTIQGEVEFTGLLKNNADPSDANSYYTDAAVAYPGDTGFAVSDIITDVFSNAWLPFSPWDDFHTEDGWSISLGLSLRDEMVDGLGTVDMTFQEVQVTATSIPVGPTIDDVSESQGINGTALGSSIQNFSTDLIIEGAGVYVAVYNAALVESDFGHGTDRKTLGSTDWTATRTVTAGVADPLFYISTAAPV
jgi:hypothetical protein